jgi:hypothetical protein
MTAKKREKKEEKAKVTQQAGFVISPINHILRVNAKQCPHDARCSKDTSRDALNCASAWLEQTAPLAIVRAPPWTCRCLQICPPSFLDPGVEWPVSKVNMSWNPVFLQANNENHHTF